MRSSGTANVLPRTCVSDGTIFLTGGTNRTVELFDPGSFSSKFDQTGWLDLFTARRAATKAAGSKWAMLLSPEKLSILGDNLLSEILGQSYIAPGKQMEQVISQDTLINPTDYLREQSSRYQIFNRTDSHWTSLGAFSAFQLLMSRLQIEVDWYRYLALEDVVLSYRGDLWSPEAAIVDKEEFRRKVVPKEIREIYANPIVGLKRKLGLENDARLHTGSHVIYFNKEAECKENVVIFGSSFSDYRLDCSLLTFLFALYFSEVHFIWSQDMDFDYVQRHRPAITITETPERFVGELPTDNLVIEQYGSARFRDWMQNPEYNRV